MPIIALKIKHEKSSWYHLHPSCTIILALVTAAASSSWETRRNDNKPFPSFTLKIKPKHHKKQRSPCRTSALVFLWQWFLVYTHQKYIFKAFKYLYIYTYIYLWWVPRTPRTDTLTAQTHFCWYSKRMSMGLIYFFPSPLGMVSTKGKFNNQLLY